MIHTDTHNLGVVAYCFGVDWTPRHFGFYLSFYGDTHTHLFRPAQSQVDYFSDTFRVEMKWPKIQIHLFFEFTYKFDIDTYEMCLPEGYGAIDQKYDSFTIVWCLCWGVQCSFSRTALELAKHYQESNVNFGRNSFRCFHLILDFAKLERIHGKLQWISFQ